MEEAKLLLNCKSLGNVFGASEEQRGILVMKAK